MLNSKSKDILLDVISKLKQRASDAVFVVEGESDRKALEMLGIFGDFFLLQKPAKQWIAGPKDNVSSENKFAKSEYLKSGLIACASEIAKRSKQAILLLDQDKKGKELARRIKNALQRHGVKVNTQLGVLLLLKAKQSNVENLSKLAVI